LTLYLAWPHSQHLPDTKYQCIWRHTALAVARIHHTVCLPGTCIAPHGAPEAAWGKQTVKKRKRLRKINFLSRGHTCHTRKINVYDAMQSWQRQGHTTQPARYMYHHSGRARGGLRATDGQKAENALKKQLFFAWQHLPHMKYQCI
jgi:hypothetical protein